MLAERGTDFDGAGALRNAPYPPLGRPAQARDAPSPLPRAHGARKAATGPYSGVVTACACIEAAPLSDIMLVRQPSRSPRATDNPHLMRYSSKPERAGRRALGAVARTGPQVAPAPDIAEAGGENGTSWSALRPSAWFCGCPHKHHCAFRPSGDAPNTLADARKGPRQHMGHSLLAHRMEAGRWERSLWNGWVGRITRLQHWDPTCSQIDGTGSLVECEGVVLVRALRHRTGAEDWWPAIPLLPFPVLLATIPQP